MDENVENRQRFPEGHYKAVAIQGMLGTTKAGDPTIYVEFELLDDQWKGERITWQGLFGDTTNKLGKTPTEITMEALRNAGWTGIDLDNLEGLGSTEVSLSIGPNTYEGKTTSKVKWVNKPSSFSVKAPMQPDEAKAFAAKMRAHAKLSLKSSSNNNAATTQTKRGTKEDDNLPF